MIRPCIASAFTFLTLLGCQAQEASNAKAIFVASDLKLLTEKSWAEDASAQAVGSLLDVIEIEGELITKSFCTAVRISPRHILTAAHCEKPNGRVVFEPHYLAASSDAKNLEYLSLGRSIRVLFRGEYDERTKENAWQGKPNLSTPIYSNKDMDFAIFDLGYDLGEGYVSIEDFSFERSSLRLYGFQNGTPLTVADHCQGYYSQGTVRHDCDALTGSSGGLVVDDQNRPLALHTFSSAKNLGGASVAQGVFEDHAALKAQAQDFLAKKSDQESDKVFWECRSIIDPEAKKNCQLGEGLNRATLLSVIKDDVRRQAPDIYLTLFSKENPSHEAEHDSSLQPASCADSMR
jgi:hypothetical protein